MHRIGAPVLVRPPRPSGLGYELAGNFYDRVMHRIGAPVLVRPPHPLGLAYELAAATSTTA